MPLLAPIGATMGAVIANLIEELKSEANGQLIDRGRVLDHLLDLRLAAGDQQAIVTMVDEILAALPGKNVVETEWWMGTLDQLGDAAQPEPAV